LAATEYRAALAVAAPGSPLAATARYGLGLSLSRLDRPDEAAEVLAPVIEWADGTPYRVAGLLLLGDARRRADDAAGAVRALRRADELADRADAAADERTLRPAILAGLAEAAWAAGDWAQVAAAADGLTQVEATDGPRRVRADFLAGAAAARSGDDRAALRRLDALLAGRSVPAATRRSATLLRGGALERLGRGEEAARAYATLEPAGPQDVHDAVVAEAMVRLAAIELQAGRPAVARRVLERVGDVPLAADRDAERTRTLARACLAMNDSAAAMDVLTAGDARHGDDDGRLAWLEGRAALAADDPARAETAFARSLRTAPAGPAATAAAFDRIVALRALERWTQASDAATKLLAALDSAEDRSLAPGALRMLAASSLDANRNDAAIEAVDRFRAEFAEHALAAEIAVIEATARERIGDHDGAAAAWGRAAAALDEDERATDALARRGLALLDGGRDAEAQTALEQALAQGRDDASIHLALGDLAMRDERWADAADRLDDALRRLPPAAVDADAAAIRRSTGLRLAHAARRAERPRAALAAADGVLAATPTPVEVARAELERGLTLETIDQSDAARAAYERTLQSCGLTGADADPGDTASEEQRSLAAAALGRLGALADARGDTAAAARRYTMLATLTGDHEAREAADLRTAVSLDGDGADDAAAAALAWERVAAQTREPERRADALGRAALARARSLPITPAADADTAADDRRVLASVERALAEPTPPAALVPALGLERVRRLRALGRTDEALAAGGETLRRHPADPASDRIRLELADLLASSARHAEADFTVTPLLAPAADRDAPVDPSVRRAAAWRAGLARRAGDRPGPAAEAFELVITLAGDDADLQRAALVLAGETRLAAGRPDAAAAHFERLVADDAAPDLRDAALLRLAECRAAQGRWAVAEQHHDAYLRRHPDGERWYAARFGRGQAREAQGRTMAAMEDYRAVAERHDGETAARAQFQLGQCLFGLGRHEEALGELLKVEILFDAPSWTAAAMHEAASCLERLGRPDEARTLLARLVREHPGTDWAGRAQRRLERAAAAG
jgi:tetratricopeptide (TPR) repeat protein